ncbi:MAG: alpha/beta hydrolase [Candidatus Thiodiazotropha sp.]
MDGLEFFQSGDGGEVVVFLNGFRMPFSSWERVYPRISEHHRVLLYNRRGVGRSEKAAADQTGETVVEDLRQLLKQRALQGPCLLVGHSLGGLFANLYARLHPADVLGVVFVDAAHPDEISIQQSIKPPRVVNGLNNLIKWIEKRFDPYRYSEDEVIQETLRQIHLAAPFPALPVTVVSGMARMPLVPQQAFEIHQDYQRALLDLSPMSERVECLKSGHFPQISEPECVVSAIMGILKRCNRSV